LAGTLRPDFLKEIIVVDISSTHETRSVISEFPNVDSVCFNHNIGYTRGVNEGIKKSKGDAVLIINPDIIPLKDSIEKMYEFLDKHPSVGMIGPQLLNFDGTYQTSFFRFPSPLTLLYRRTFLGNFGFGKRSLDYFTSKEVDHSTARHVDWLMGSALMVRVESIRKVGLMDENFFLYMSDIDWPKRFWENGYTVLYFPESKMYHYHRRDSKGRFGMLDVFFKKESRWHLKDAIRYFRKHGIRAANSIAITR
jgi:GT2 family glycosyltransferase